MVTPAPRSKVRRVNLWEFLTFRHLLVLRYRKTYNMLLKRLIAGPVLHIDETEVRLRTGKGYVWVLATPEAAVYLYRPTREGDFLPGLDLTTKPQDFPAEPDVMVTFDSGSIDRLGDLAASALAAKELIDSVDDAYVIDVVDGPNTQHLSHDRNQGVLVCNYDWEFQGGGPPSHGEGGD